MKPTQKRQTHTFKNGFTLVETLVAVTILLVAIVMPLQIVGKAISLGARSKDELIASYLAQDAIEFVRYKIVTNRNEMNVSGTGTLLDGLNDCLDADGCTLDTVEGSVFQETAPICNMGLRNGNYYGKCVDGNNGWWATDFQRTVTIEQRPGPANSILGANTEFYVVSTVSWGKLLENSLTVSEDIIDWRVIFD